MVTYSNLDKERKMATLLIKKTSFNDADGFRYILGDTRTTIMRHYMYTTGTEYTVA
jgi:hypothetical protein